MAKNIKYARIGQRHECTKCGLLNGDHTFGCENDALQMNDWHWSTNISACTTEDLLVDSIRADNPHRNAARAELDRRGVDWRQYQ